MAYLVFRVILGVNRKRGRKKPAGKRSVPRHTSCPVQKEVLPQPQFS